MRTRKSFLSSSKVDEVKKEVKMSIQSEEKSNEGKEDYLEKHTHTEDDSAEKIDDRGEQNDYPKPLLNNYSVSSEILKASGDSAIYTVTQEPSQSYEWNLENLSTSQSEFQANKRSAEPMQSKRDKKTDEIIETYQRLTNLGDIDDSSGRKYDTKFKESSELSEMLSKEDNKIENNIRNVEMIIADNSKHSKKDKSGVIIPPKRKVVAAKKGFSPVFKTDMGYEFQSREEVLLFIGFANYLKIKHNLNPTKFNIRLKLLKDFHYIVVFKKKEFYASLVRGYDELNKFYMKIRMRSSLMDGLLNAGYHDKFFTEYLPNADTFYNNSPENTTINIDGNIISKGIFECMVEDSYSNFMENVLYEDKLSI